MSRYKNLVQERADLVAEAKALFGAAEVDDRELTEDERARDDQIAARLDVLAGEIGREERRREWERTVEPVTKSSNALPRISGMHDRAEDKPWESFGEQLLAVRQASLAGGYVDPRLRYEAQLGANVGVGSEGGFLLATQHTAGLWQRVYETGEIMGRTFKIDIGNDADSVVINGMAETSRATGSRWGGMQAYWVAEATNLTASQMAFRRLRFSPHKLAVLTYATGEMLRNPRTLESVINQVVPQEIAWMSENSFVRGVGGGQPLGILNADSTTTPASGAFIPVAAEAGQAAGTIVSENISNMWSRMWARSRANAVWLINQDCEPQLDALSVQVGVGGVPVYMPPGGLADAPYGRLKGRPVIPVEYCSTVGTVGDILLVDWSQYGTSDRGGIQAASSIHVQFISDQMAYRFIYEIDGQPMWHLPLTPANGTNTLSPYIGLATRP
jgi:HK97 family phage major capsid protein